MRRMVLPAAWALVAAQAAFGAAASAEAPAVCFAPGTPPERVAEVYARARRSGTSLDASLPSDFRASSRWTTTATNGGGLGQGAPTTLTWSIVPDGTQIAAASGFPAGQSTLVARLNALYGSQATWLPLFQQVFDRWSQLTGISYVYQPTDDGGPLPGSTGALGVRGDVRISGMALDGNFGVLGYNYFPNSGDMVLDAPDSFYSNTANGSLGLRNVLSHEHGHGIGLSHVCPVNETKLMEPFLTTDFVGPQHDDTLGGQRQYGDTLENNDTSGTGTNLGSLANGVTNVNDVGGDNNVDSDFYRFTVPAGKQAAVTMTPEGFTYLEGPQVGGSCGATTSFNSLVLNDLGVQLLGTDGSTILGASTGNPAGVAESIPVTVLGAAGTYSVRVAPGPTNQVQLYRLAITISDAAALSVNDVSLAEGNAGTTNATFTVSLSVASSQVVSVSYSTASGTATAGVDYGTVAGTISFPAGSTAQTVHVPIVGERIAEGDETFFVNLSGPTGAMVADGQGAGTIVNDDVAGLTIGDAVVRERVGPATAVATFTVTLSPSSGSPVTVNWATANGTATAGSDYVAGGGTLTFNPGVGTQPVSVVVNADALVEGVETFTVGLSGASGATIAHPTGTARILDPPAGGDFNADNRNDLLWRHDVSGENVLWFMNGVNLVSGVFTTPPTLTDVRWKMVGTNDFNADGRPDILWRHSTSGENVLWYMNGSVLINGTFLTPSALTDTRWGMAGTGDFNLDGRPDILWRHSTSGEIVVWFMNGSVLTAGTFLTPPAFTDVNWQTVGTGDFNLDGKTDILWRHALSGQNVVWLLEGTSLISGAFTNPPTLADVNWRMVATGDYNFDGRVDIVWRHSASGQNVMWFMNGIDLISGAFTNPSSLPDTNWKIVGPR
jgi:hypothetical protein